MSDNQINKRILIIDDEELINKSLSKLLKINGYEAFIAKTGQDAIDLTENQEFDLIISDIRMPGLNGIDAVKSIYSKLDEVHLIKPPVIFITGYADHESEKEANSLKPIDYIYKPFDIKDLINRIKKVLG